MNKVRYFRSWLVSTSRVLQCQGLETYHKHKGHEAAEDREQNMPALIAEAATSLKQDERGNKKRADGVQQGPMDRRQ